MKHLFLFCLKLIVFSLNLHAQDSRAKEQLLSAGKSEKERLKKNPKLCENSNFQRSIDFRCFESYPTDKMTWGIGFSEGLAKINVNGRAGFINGKGEIVIKPTLKDAGNFSENLAPFESKNGKWGFIDKTGKVAVKPQFDWAVNFSDGFALVQIGKLWGYIDRTGKIVIEPKFEEASSFEEDFAVVGYYDKDYVWTTHKRDNGKWQRNFIDKTGKFKFAKPFDGISRGFNGGMALVNRNIGYNGNVISESYFIDTKGNELWKLNSWYISSFSDDLIDVAVSRDNETGRDKYSFLDRNGKRVTDKVFDSPLSFSEGFAVVSVNGKDGFIDKCGEFVIEPKFSDAQNFSEGLAAVWENNDSGFIDVRGNFRFKLNFNWTDGFEEGYAAVAVGDKVGYIDKSGEYIWKPTK